MYPTSRVLRCPVTANGAVEGGFTLLELIAVLVISAMALAVSAPATMRLYESVQYRGAVRDVVDLLTAARYAAISTGQTSEMTISPQTRELKQGSKHKQLPESIELEVVSARELNRADTAVIRFYPDGSSSGGQVRLLHENGLHTQVEIDWLLGRIELCNRDCADAASPPKS